MHDGQETQCWIDCIFLQCTTNVVVNRGSKVPDFLARSTCVPILFMLKSLPSLWSPDIFFPVHSTYKYLGIFYCAKIMANSVIFIIFLWNRIEAGFLKTSFSFGGHAGKPIEICIYLLDTLPVWLCVLTHSRQNVSHSRAQAAHLMFN